MSELHFAIGAPRTPAIVACTIPFSLLFASICLDLRHIPANLLSLGALDFGMVVDGSVVMVENILRHLGANRDRNVPVNGIVRNAAHEVQKPVFYAIGIIIIAYVPPRATHASPLQDPWRTALKTMHPCRGRACPARCRGRRSRRTRSAETARIRTKRPKTYGRHAGVRPVWTALGRLRQPSSGMPIALNSF